MEIGLASKNEVINWADYGFYEYLLAAHPDEAVNQKVIEEKNSFYKDYQQKIAVKTRPHITVANFLAREQMEETLIRWMQRIFSDHPAFTVTLNNYSGFPEHTIYLRVLDHQPFKQLGKRLQVIESFIKDNTCPPMKIISNPHISIARRLPQPVYEKAMMDYSAKTFHESFTVKELVLLRRQHQFANCEQVVVFGLLPENKLFN